MPHSYTNLTTTDGSAVIKSYQGPDAAQRCAREAAMLSALAGRLPVPPVLDRNEACLRLGFLPGVHGQELIDSGMAGPVLAACGRMLRRIHAVSLHVVPVMTPRGGSPVLVHGDYGPQNMLLDPAASEVSAVVDWEWAHAGDRLEDLSWCEWIIRMHHPAHVRSLGRFFDAYGEHPPWAARYQAMTARCRALLAVSEERDPEGQDSRLWQRCVQITQSWAE
jgi:aminoglycoside phosphotransferase